MRFTAIISFVIVFALSAAWAMTTYYGEITIQKHNNHDEELKLVDGLDKINIKIPAGSLNDYMAEQNINNVTVTVDLTEEWIDTGDGNGYYQLNFTFGPSEAYFTPKELEVVLYGKYISDSTSVAMYDENGELLDSRRQSSSGKLIFYVPHFSSYYYDDYDEY